MVLFLKLRKILEQSMLTYHEFYTSSTEEWVELLNLDMVRKHLIKHPMFTTESVKVWLQSKIKMNQERSCILREIRNEGKLIGWCGIQIESGDYELALVLSPKYWGHGRDAINQLKIWAQELGHNQLLMHIPQTRPQKKALERLFGKPIKVSNIKDSIFNTYRIEI